MVKPKYKLYPPWIDHDTLHGPPDTFDVQRTCSGDTSLSDIINVTLTRSNKIQKIKET